MTVGRLLRRVRTLLRRRKVDDEVARELDFHIEMEALQRARAGLQPDEARRAALRDFGEPARVREHVRDVRGMTVADGLEQDVRFALRTLRRSPGFTIAAVLILALGIGANTAMFSVIDGVLLEPLPFRNGDELVLIQQAATKSDVPDAGVSIPELARYRGRLASIRDLVEYHSMSFTLLNQGEPDRVDTGVVSANFFSMLGIAPLYGRTFADADDDLGAEAVLVLSHAYWRDKFGADPRVVGRVLEMNNRPHTVVGVLPEYPQYPRRNDVYMPTSACPFRAAAERTLPLGHRSFAGLRVFGRLASGAGATAAGSEVATVAASFEADHPQDYARTRSLGIAGRVQPLREQLVEGARPMLLALTGTTLLVLLIACANVANLALARTLQRHRELAVRSALGAGRARIVRQLVTESLIVAIAGGVLGLGLAWLSLDLIVGFVGRFTERTGEIAVDGRVLAFTVAASIVSGIAFAAAPALATRRNLAEAMREGSAQTGDGGGRRRLRSGLVVAQVAVSFALLVGAALLLESFYRLSSVPLGYTADRVMTAAIFGNFSRGTTPEDALRLQTGILDRLRAAPDVDAAAMTNAVPQSDIQPFNQPLRLDGIAAGDGRRLEADGNLASDGYFETLGIPLLAGRDIRATDTRETAPVAVINASMAKLWDGVDPIGRRFAIDGPPPPGQPDGPRWLTVVGIVPDFRLYSVDREIPAAYYTPAAQSGFGAGRLVVRARSGNPYDLVRTIKAAVHGVDAQVPVEELVSLRELRDTRLTTPAVTTALLTIFAVVALAVTLAGLAGVIGTSVSQRTREFGLRMALGASRSSVLQLVLRQGLVLVAAGIALGVAGAYAFGRLIARYLFETTPTDALAYAGVALLFVLAALTATFGPARRATTVDPLRALRSE
jgi:predicted permease